MKKKFETSYEEIANVITHGLGVVLTLIAMPVTYLLVTRSQSNTAYMFAISIYLLSLLSMYGTSTLYHLLAGERVKRLFQILDHISIYLLIAGTNTYFISRYIESDVALIFLLVQWSLVLGGIIFKVFYTGRFDVISTFFYIALGLMAVLLIRSLWYNMPLTVFAWIIAGGAFYILGTIFYLWQKLRFHHAIWHLFVFGGTVSHYVALIYGL